VAKIHATKLTLDDALGANLPPDPGEKADDTIAGFDVNQNGIRDDVELAIFAEYPNSAKTRAVLLQYALVLQMQMTLPIINKDTATAVAEEDSRSYDCIGVIVPRSDDDLEKIKLLRVFVENKQINTTTRKNKQENYFDYIESYTLQSGCDIDLFTLPN